MSSNHRKPTHLDLYSGVGGFALAAEWAGFRTVGFSEIDPYCIHELGRIWPDVPQLGDITCLDCTQFRTAHGVPDLVTAGTPCQPASLLGERRGEDDDRWLWPDTLRVLRQLRPGFAVLENPPALLTLDDGRPFNRILGELAALGYDCFWECVSAGAYGAGHRRERILVLAAHSDRSGLEGYPRHGPECRHERPDGSTTPPDLRTRSCGVGRWYTQSGIKPLADGVPERVARLTAIGNSVVPQVIYPYLQTLRRYLP